MNPTGRNRDHTGDAGIHEIEREIENTRSALGETTAALADKLDPKTRAKQALRETRETGRKHRPALICSTAAGLTAVVVAIVIWRRNS